MDKKFCRSILLMVNQKDTYEMLQDYVEYRIATLREQLENAHDIDQMRQIQGSIRELKRFKTLRDEIVTGAK